MKSLKDGAGYNERLFSGGLRAKLHQARFHWVREQVVRRGLDATSLLELGCFDGKLLDFLPRKPNRYKGFDANWEGGLTMARERWADEPAYEFCEATSSDDMQLAAEERFSLGVSMETIEHIPPHLVDGYLAKLAHHVDGHVLITVPNEKGIVFVSKYLAKRMLSKDVQDYSLSEFTNAAMGRMEKVRRAEHKGFDYDALLRSMSEHFDILEVSGHPFSQLPHPVCFGIGIVARSKKHRPAASV